jgi:hypothetical protein
VERRTPPVVRQAGSSDDEIAILPCLKARGEPSLRCEICLDLRDVIDSPCIIPAAGVPPSDTAPHHLVRRSIGIRWVARRRRAFRQVTDCAFKARSLLCQLVVDVECRAQVRITIRVGHICGVLSGRHRFASGRIILRLDLDNSQADSAANISDRRLNPMALIDRSGSRYVLVEAPLARSPLQHGVSRTGELTVGTLEVASWSTSLATGYRGFEISEEGCRWHGVVVCGVTGPRLERVIRYPGRAGRIRWQRTSLGQ